jgi:putative transport protein
LQKLLDLPMAAALGVFSGAVTNTPSLGATQQALADMKLPADQLALPGLGYAIAYPFGIIGILLTMVALRVVFRIRPAEVAAELEAKRLAEAARLETRDISVADARWPGQILRHLPGVEAGELTVSRLMRGGVLQAPHDATRLELGDVLHLVGPREALDMAQREGRAGVSQAADHQGHGADMGAADRHQRRRAGAHAGGARHRSRLRRAHFARGPRRRRDRRPFGREAAIRRRAQRHRAERGHPARRRDPRQFASAAEGVRAPADVHRHRARRDARLHRLFRSRLAAPIKLGLAGGPLLAAIALSRVGHIGPLLWFTPPGAVAALRELGIVLFLAVVGFNSGGRFVETLLGGDGLRWMLVGAAITLVPLIVAGLIAQLAMKLDYLSICGLLAGSMTDPPALAFANAMAPESQTQAQAYAAVYPLVMALRILTPQILAFALM